MIPYSLYPQLLLMNIVLRYFSLYGYQLKWKIRVHQQSQQHQYNNFQISESKHTPSSWPCQLGVPKASLREQSQDPINPL